MNREIKFRFWDKALQKMILRTLLPYDNEHPDIEIMQFTGLKDKNGQEIYEGDVVKSVYGNGYIVFEYIGFAIKSIGSESIDFEFPSFYLNSEIIGNIYENPELL